MDKQVVVAKFKEDTSWVQHLFCNVKIYDKNKDYLNIGREAETYLRHIIENYENLADVTFFLQGNPFDHFSGDLFRLINDYNSTEPIVPLGEILECDRQGFPHHKLELGRFSDSLFKTKYYNFQFVAGAQYAVAKKAIIYRSKNFYEKIYDQIGIEETFPWIMERLWMIIFGPLA